MPRPSRAHLKRGELITAARQAVLERGVLDLRLRDVAEQADMSTGSVLYYFPTLGDLLYEVQREAVERFCVDREEAARAEPDPRRKLVVTIRAGLPTGQDDELCVLIYELGAYARRDPAYAAEHIRLYERQVALYTAILEAGTATGLFDPVRDTTTIARGLVALEDGLGLHITQAVPTFTTEQAEAMLVAYAADATRCELET
ncbi:TetR/AcrR family transcriptional regulator [Saccharothrix violaceirubra]|uniref:AcrR family transcriptional regulator n=1 Tax=Saccharothrix violaceirubra TaxID=413306 RepID=A0A7W7T4I1_9PSEU|nr:TetR family transcriptional regulator C-terminal domain-containing protein [Saccharothrix violaceirubra]MBB4966381.1 AcrR family transcriptional regulator [Saccharothrix violaceirubra]